MSDDDAPQGSIDWATADGQGREADRGDRGRSGRRVVAHACRTWSNASTARGAPWGKVKATKALVRVESVGEGAEGDLRHLLEGAVLQVNADFAQDDEDEGGEQSEADRAMTEAFRGFAD